jgi:hypothetical protein
VVAEAAVISGKENKNIMKARKPFLRKLKRLVVCIGVAVFLMGVVAPANLGLAQGRYYREEWKLPNFYPKGFDGYGRINRIGDEEIVISETRLKLSPGITYATPRSRHASKYAFQTDDLVAYLVNREREIVSLWLIK